MLAGTIAPIASDEYQARKSASINCITTMPVMESINGAAR
jgi:hypothetical protein